jgi:hypothetical protein
MDKIEQAVEQTFETVEIDVEGARAVTLEEIATREVQECACICYYPAR